MLTLQQIIMEADNLVDNGFTNADKIVWLNEINNEFFDIVKIPKIAKFDTTAGTDSYALPDDVRAKNINMVRVGFVKYRSMMEEEVQPGQNYWIFDDETKEITLNPAPFKNGYGIARYYRIATTSFTTSNLNVTPDAPPEYHWIYAVGLCERLALGMDDIPSANNFGKKYRDALQVAAQNYRDVRDNDYHA